MACMERFGTCQREYTRTAFRFYAAKGQCIHTASRVEQKYKIASCILQNNNRGLTDPNGSDSSDQPRTAKPLTPSFNFTSTDFGCKFIAQQDKTGTGRVSPFV